MLLITECEHIQLVIVSFHELVTIGVHVVNVKLTVTKRVIHVKLTATIGVHVANGRLTVTKRVIPTVRFASTYNVILLYLR